jgi:ferritin-like metal-binding protein YciE
MAITSLKDLYFDELSDLYDAEMQMIRTLPRLAEAARAPELREALRRHGDESRLHLERLELIFTHWGERRRAKPCAGLAGIVQEADDRLNQEATDDVRDAGIIGAAQRIEHYEIAAYGCARTYARRLNRSDEARLLQETLDEEERTDRRLTEMAEAHINDDARSESDMREASASGRLQYVPLENLERSRHLRELTIRNEADAELGRLDGLVADSDSGIATYAVVDEGGLFSHRRHLLPVTMIRYDETAHVLRVDLDAALASRYPEFDRDEFQAMSVSDRRGYEMRLLEFFPRTQMFRSQSDEGANPPEWAITGAWVTVPPQRAERLSPEARSFANEFAPDRGQAVARANDEPPPPGDGESDAPPQGDKLR